MLKFALAAIVALSCSFAHAETVTQAPKFSPRDIWSYERVNSYTETILGRNYQSVTEVTPGTLKLRIKNEGGNEYDALYSNEGNFMSNPTETWRAPKPILHFPLKVGGGWTESFSMTTGAYVASGTYQVKVVGFEKVETPAGDFDAWKLEFILNSQRNDYPGMTYTARQVYWYAPSVKRIVRDEYDDGRTKVKTWLVGYRVENDAGVVAQYPVDPASGGGVLADLAQLLQKVRPALGAVSRIIR